MSQALRVLVVDDEKISRETTARLLSKAGYETETAENAFRALDRVDAADWDVILTDLRMPTMDGLEFLREVKKRSPETEVIVMTAYGSVESAVTAMREGAADYLLKPFGFDELNVRLQRIKELHDSRNEIAKLHAILGDVPGPCGIVGQSPAMRFVLERIELFADNPAPVLITGETGTGKELVARALHDRGRRSKGPFVAVACGAIPKDLAESELFGHEKGAFTGAIQRRQGSFERANGGTILLDDLDDLPLDIQAKLLRVLQEGSFLRVGGTQEIQTDARVIATTKIDLAGAVDRGEFREDLFYRIRGLEIPLPPLRERGEDVLLLAQHFLRTLALQAGDEPKKLSPQAGAVLRNYRWPGNVRELRRVMETASAICPGPEVGPEHLPAYLSEREGESDKPFTLHLEGQERLALHELVERFEDEVINWALRQAGGQQTKAADLLGVPRTTLQSKLFRVRQH
ncbi:MAG: sigma-54-dependent Fis family transcriptional regulator [Candidatus Dadabacteria bacterium]|nr:MAG: sigma-54-dependent Fis family transcriptional regulator [Candidatus Dadabacteria bacterium]